MLAETPLNLCRQAQCDVEMQLQELKIQSKFYISQLKTAALSATEELAAKVEVVSSDVVQLQMCNMGLRRSMLAVFESHRNLDNHIICNTVPREEYQQAMEEVTRLRSMVEELGQQVQQTKDESVLLHGTLQVNHH